MFLGNYYMGGWDHIAHNWADCYVHFNVADVYTKT